jgi:hypothetical protein
VPRRFQGLQPHLPELQGVALSKSSEVKIRLSLGSQTNRGSNAVSQLDVARKKIGMKMGEEDIVNVKLVLGGVVEILIDIALRVNDNGGAARLIGDKVGGMRETTEVILFHPHGIFLLCVFVATSPPRHPYRLSASMGSIGTILLFIVAPYSVEALTS